MAAVLLWLIIVLITLLLIVIVAGAAIVVCDQRKRNHDRGPQGFQGVSNDGTQGRAGTDGANGAPGSAGDRGFQGVAGISIAISSNVQTLTFHARDGIAFNNDLTTANFPGYVFLAGKLLTLQFSQVLVHTTVSNLRGFTLSLDLPAGYSMVSNTTPFISWLGAASNLNQQNSTSTPIYLFDFIKDSDTTFTMRWVPMSGTLNLQNVVHLWCNFNIVVNIV